MNATRRLSIAALVVACLHLVFGAIVRISGSGMGCGDHWPKCYGYWFPPFNRPDLIVEVSHRYLASILTLTVLSMALVAWRNRRVAGIGGKGGAMRSAFGAVGAVFTAAILGGVTVKMGNAPWATVAHWLVAMTLLAMVATTAIRSGALGGASSLVQRGSQRARRSGFAAAGLAIFAVALGGLTAKYPGAAVGCTTVPMCGANPSVQAASVHVQITHRTIAVLLVLHLIGVVMMVRKRRAEEAPVVVRAAHVALGMVLLQLVVASAMVLFHLPPVLRSLHEATGVGIWLSCFTLAYLARRASNVTPPEPATLPDPSPKGGISLTREPVSGAAAMASKVASNAGVVATIVETAPVVAEAAWSEELPPALTIVSEVEIVGTEPEADAAAEAAVIAELILAIEDAAKEAAFESAEARAREAAIVAEAIAAIAPAEDVSVVETTDAPTYEAIDENEAAVEELTSTPSRAEAEELNAFSLAELEAEVAALEAAQVEAIAVPVIEAAVVAPVIEAAVVAPVIEAAVVTPVIEAAVVAPVIEAAVVTPEAIEDVGVVEATEAPTYESIDEAVVEELDWTPRRAEAEELDEFSIAALEAEVAALEAAQAEASAAPVIEAVAIADEPVVIAAPVTVAEPMVVEPVVIEAPVVIAPAEQVTADASVVAPPVKAPPLSPIPAPTMAVLVARGADFL